jgi:nucleoside-diphosphate-sugar epimerase
MDSNFTGPVNIGSEEMVTINQLASMTIDLSEKELTIKNIEGEEFVNKYGFKCPLGVKGRNSDNKLYYEKVGWQVSQPLSIGLKKTYEWINLQVKNKELDTRWIYESPDNIEIYRRDANKMSINRTKIN